MIIRNETDEYLTAVERFAQRRFQHRYEIGLLIDVSRLHALDALFAEVTFQSKFLSHAVGILKRSGIENDETENLSREVRQGIERTIGYLQTLVVHLPEVDRKSFQEKFLFLSQESMASLMDLLSELAWVKNFSIDRRNP